MSHRIFIADDHGVVRDGLRRLVNSQPDMECVGEAESTALVAERVAETRPDIVLLDITMPGGDPLEEIPQIKAAHRGTRVLVLTMHEDRSHVRRAVAQGADGYVVKRVAPNQLLGAIRSVGEGHACIDVMLEDGGLRSLLGTAPAREEPPAVIAELSPREREILRLIAGGYTNQRAAELLGLSVKTVESYRARLAQKLGARGRADLVRVALDAGLLDEEDPTDTD